MKVLLMHTSPFVTHRPWNYLEHLGLGFLEKAFQDADFEVDVFDATWNWEGPEAAVGRALPPRGPYGLIGFSVSRSNFISTIEAVRRLRQEGTDAHITLGGYFATFHAEKILQNFPDVDTMVLGHGEYTLVGLCRALRDDGSVRGIPGLACRAPDGHVVWSPCYENEAFLRKVGIPVHRPRYGVARVITSRGCSRRCTFCCVNSFDRFNFRTCYHRRPLQEVVAEVDMLVTQHGVRHIWFSDMDFVGPERRCMWDFCDAMIQRNWNVTFEGDCRMETLDEPFIRQLSRAGFRCLFLGVESFADRQLRDYSKLPKGYDRRSIFSIVEIMQSYGIVPRFGFIMFDKDTALEELELNHRVISETVGYGTLDGLANKLTLLPGTPIEKRYLTDREHCFRIEIGAANRMKPHCYYTQFTFRDQRVAFAYRASFTYRSKFARLQALFEDRLRADEIDYPQHSSGLWRLRDMFGRIYERILAAAADKGRTDLLSEDLRARLDDMLVDHCASRGLDPGKARHLLEEEDRHPGEPHP